MTSSPVIVLCNHATPPKGVKRHVISLNYISVGRTKPNVRIGLPLLVQAVYHLPTRILDLIEIACYVFAADRYTSRGALDAVEFHSWAREFRFFVRVRDPDFWNSAVIRQKLEDLLRFISGDGSFTFTFQSGQDTAPVDLFDKEEFQVSTGEPTNISLFSGGHDSLVGAINLLGSGNEKLCLVSHQSGQPQTMMTQDSLAEALSRDCPGKIRHYRFRSGLKEKHAKEESQRTRTFLYSSIAMALVSAYKQDHFYIFENGVTSLNFPRREDLKNARASRTTHPKTIGLLKELLSEMEGRPIDIRAPFFWKTKSEVLEMLKAVGKEDLLTSSVSCSRTFQPFERGTHCGVCYQCLDRRFAIYSSELDGVDNAGLYNSYFVLEPFSNSESRNTLFGYVRQAKDFAGLQSGPFYRQYLPELSEVVDYIEGENDERKALMIADLCRRHGEQVWKGTERMRVRHDNPRIPVARGSYLHIVNQREYLQDPTEQLMRDIVAKLDRAIPIAYKKSKPKNENRLNDTIQSLLISEREFFHREYPSIPFGLCRTIPDHSWGEYRLLLEAKYLRRTVTLSKVTDQIGADLLKYPKESKILFIIYDPYRLVYDDVRFANDIQTKDARCVVAMIR